MGFSLLSWFDHTAGFKCLNLSISLVFSVIPTLMWLPKVSHEYGAAVTRN